jgi:ferredoxin-NADP reductase
MTDQATPAKVRLTDVLGPNARKLASQLQNAAYNCGYEDAHPSNATTRQAKADAKCREVLAALYSECDRLAAAEAKTNSYIVDNARLAEKVENLRAALQWYADGLHFDKASPDAWDTVSGEPQNWWCDEAGTATVEDGSIAAMVLRGELTGAQVQALD